MRDPKPIPPQTLARGLELEPYQVVLRPIISEKCTHLVERHNIYAFEVHKLATKDQIAEAVERLFDVLVIDIRTQNYVGKKKRFKFRVGKQADWKKAYVKLSDDDRIPLF